MISDRNLPSESYLKISQIGRFLHAEFPTWKKWQLSMAEWLQIWEATTVSETTENGEHLQVVDLPVSLIESAINLTKQRLLQTKKI